MPLVEVVRMAVTASEARARLFPLIEQVNDDQVAVEIVSKKGTAYPVPAADYESLLETMHLLSSPANAARLRASVAAAHGGRARARSRRPPRRRRLVRLVFADEGWEDCASWVDQRKVLLRTNRMIEESEREPGTGIGEPERLSGDLTGSWSRRIGQEHRLVCAVIAGDLVVVQARYHC